MTSKVAIVTAAGSGLGAGIARQLAKDGWKVAVASSSGKGEKLGKELGGIGFTASNEDPAGLERVVNGTLDAWGRIDALVNSSGHPPKGDLLAITDADWHRGLDMILLSVVRLSRLVVPVMERQGGGAIVNVSTFAAFEPDLAFPVSCALRAALGSYAKLFSDRYAKANIRMNNVLPGFFDSLPEKEAAKQRVPLGRYGRVEELAKTVSFLLSDGAGYITGQNLRVDGGITRGV
jgi:NAD(P)-dependent dehydrogenase (short-subunit alcohol dehydrogenase family)